MNKHIRAFIANGSLALLFSPLLSLAQSPVAIQPLPSPAGNFGDLLGKVCTLGNYLFTALLVVAIIFVIFAAFKYLTAAGDAEKVKSANHQILYAAIAVGVGIFAKVVPLIVGNFLTSGSAGGGVQGVC